VHVVVPQAGALQATVAALRSAQVGWLAAACLASDFTYLMAAVAVIGASGRPLPLAGTIGTPAGQRERVAARPSVERPARGCLRDP